ncbi:hypothetical protein Tco_0899152 [Tanacetum coccineum]
MAELFLNKCMEKAQTESDLSITNTNTDMNIKLNQEFLTELQNNAYHEIHHEDVVDHIAMVLEMLDLINIPGPHRKEIDNVGRESTIWNSESVGVLELQDGCSIQNLAHKLNIENLPSKISGEYFILILLNSRI